MPRYASIDIGSNSVRMEAAEVTAGEPSRILASERQVTRLGASVFRTGRISQESMDSICGVLGSMAQQYKRLEINSVRAVGTAGRLPPAEQGNMLERIVLKRGGRRSNRRGGDSNSRDL